jgi:hypothetical protein
MEKNVHNFHSPFEMKMTAEQAASERAKKFLLKLKIKKLSLDASEADISHSTSAF